jgi:predicted TIM-barrel fold metal-dependent hydrolase
MDEAGVDGAILVSPWALYGGDASYIVEAHDAHPGRFALVSPVDPYAVGAAEYVETWSKIPDAVGVRLMIASDTFAAKDSGVRTVINAAARRGLAVCVFCWGRLAMMDELAREYPDAQFVVDHLGLPQPITPPRLAHPFEDLDTVLALARYPNVAMKVSGASTMSRRPFPFEDLWEPLGRLFGAFGIDRCMWGSDWTRTVEFVTYPEEVAAFRDHLPLSPTDRASLMSGTVERIFGWSPIRR